MKTILTSCVLALASVAACAQNAEPAKALDAMIMQLEHDLVPAAKAMPADKYNFAPSPETLLPAARRSLRPCAPSRSR